MSQRYISGKRWNEHFKKVMINEDWELAYPPDSNVEGPL